MTTKPERFLWATNTNHAAGADPWSGQPCKVEPTAGKKATGWVPEERPPAEEHNWLTNQISLWTKWASSLQVRTWQGADFSLVTPLTDWATASGQPHCMCSVPSATSGVWDGAIAIDEDSWAIRGSLFGLAPQSTDDMLWTPEGNGLGSLRNLWGALAANPHMGVASNYAGSIVAVVDDGSAVDMVADTIIGTMSWAAIGALALTVRWRAVANDWKNTPSTAGTWIVGAHNGLIYAYNSTLGAWTSAGIPYAQPVDVLAHTHDSANSYFLGAVTNRIIKSTTGLSGSWSVVNPSWGGFWCSGLAYDADSQRWIAVGYASAGDLWVSDDNGATWVQKAAACPMQSATGRKSIACDGHGAWVITGSTENTGTDDPIYVSVDNGDTWEKVWYPLAFRGGVTYHNGRFVTCGSVAGGRSLVG